MKLGLLCCGFFLSCDQFCLSLSLLGLLSSDKSLLSGEGSSFLLSSGASLLLGFLLSRDSSLFSCLLSSRFLGSCLLLGQALLFGLSFSFSLSFSDFSLFSGSCGLGLLALNASLFCSLFLSNALFLGGFGNGCLFSFDASFLGLGFLLSNTCFFFCPLVGCFFLRDACRFGCLSSRCFLFSDASLFCSLELSRFFGLNASKLFSSLFLYSGLLLSDPLLLSEAFLLGSLHPSRPLCLDAGLLSETSLLCCFHLGCDSCLFGSSSCLGLLRSFFLSCLFSRNSRLFSFLSFLGSLLSGCFLLL